jgi:hypothetical protein
LDEQPGDLVFDGLLATLISPAHDRLETVVVLEKAGVEFGLDGAGGRGAGEAGEADFLGDACMKFQHGVGSCWVWFSAGFTAALISTPP